MTPTPQETRNDEKTVPRPLQRPLSGEEVVISGMSGIFPNSDSVQELMENLYNKVDMVTSDNPRWVSNHPEIPKHFGKVNGINKFDAQFFRVSYKQGCTSDPMSRKLLEHAYSAIYDSGTNPLQLHGKNVGVFIGSTYSESEKFILWENVQRSGLGILGGNRCMYANRISYWMDSKGPSYSLDLACASSMACLEHALRSIRSGQCEAAIVGGSNLCMEKNVFLHLTKAGFLCFDGKTKCFDKNGDGHVRADAISVLFLQKAKDAKRIYSEVYHAKVSYSPLSEPVLPVRQPKELQEFFESFYSEIGVSPNDVEYIEANGSAFPEADSNELKVIGKVFAKKSPVKIGCVKSNMGSSEAASGTCGLTKVCLSYHKGKLPGNLHYSEPLDLPEVRENKVQVLTDNTNFGRGFAALNSFSYSGCNVHVLLKGHYKQKNTERYSSSIPHLVLISGRQENCVKKILQKFKKNPVDPEQIRLLHGIHEFNIPGHMSRGYSILGSNEKKETVCLSESVEYFPEKTRPVWFVYSGMGSQWATMGAELMRIPIFAAAIQKCHKVLEPKGVDIVRILTDPDKTIYDNILHSFVGIAAVQIGLTDILKEMRIVPDNIIGHSVGELGCAYADGCLTAEEMILSAYSRGLVSVQTPFIRGSMAAVGLGYKAILPLCPPEIEVACHNSPESSTISGPADIMKQFVSKLTSQGIFAKEVPCSNIAYHSRYIAKAGPGLLKYLGEVIKNPKARSKKWVSTSVPQDQWNESLAKYSSAEYHTNNLLNSVLFEETSTMIPSDALVIEIAPHGLLQAILKRSLSECVHVPLTSRGSADPVKFFLEAIGKLYQAGLNPRIDILYPKIEFPVSTGTPLLSQYVEWEHSEDWPHAARNVQTRVAATIRDFVMSLYDDDFKYFQGHVRNGACIFPESAILVLIWETFGMYKGVNYKDMSVVFENVHFHGQAIIKLELPVRFQIMIQKGNNKFEVTYEDYTIVSGCIYESKLKAQRNLQQNVGKSENILLNSKDIYTIMRLKGYDYKDEFQSIHSVSSNRHKANIKWTENWITYLDSLIQFNTLAKDYDGVSTVLLINKLRIDVNSHKKAERVTFDNVTCLNADFYSIYEHTRCGGVEIDGLVFKDEPKVEQESDVLLTQSFIPNFLAGIVSMKTALQVNLQIVSENVTKSNVRVIDFISEESSEVKKKVAEVAAEISAQEFIIEPIKDEKIQSLENTDLLIIDNLLADDNEGNKKMNEIYNILPNNTFILALEQPTTEIHPEYPLFNVVTAITVQTHILVLLRKIDNNTNNSITFMHIVHDRKFSWISQLRAELEKTRKVVFVSERQPYCGLLGIVKKLRKEYGNKIGLIIVDDYHVPSFNPEIDIYKSQLKKNMAFNILNKGQWGGYYYISGEPTKQLENLHLSSTMPGDLDALSWIEKPPMTTTRTLVQVYCSGVSITDAKIAAGESSTDEQALGMDFSGIDERDEKVMGIVSGGAIRSTVEADPDFLWPVPEHWTLEDAATVPLAYAHAYYCLTIKFKVRRGSVVLINGGAGAFGQASIAVCLSQDCKVFVTVTDINQKEFLLKMFPDLEEDNIGRIPQLILREIGINKNNNITFEEFLPVSRCDVVINYLSGPLRRAAMKCLKFHGYFLDVNDYDMRNNEDFGMSFCALFKSYVGVRFNTVFMPKYFNDKKLIQLRITEGIASGIVRPLSRVVYNPADVTRAFRLLSSNKPRSQVLIRMNSSKSMDQLMSVTTRMTYSPKGSYIVICDGTALSIELADRLVKHGARNLVLQMKPNSIAGYCHSKFLSWNKQDVSLKIFSESLHAEKGCVNLLKESAKLGPIRGIFIVHNFNSGIESWAPEDIGATFNKTVSVVANLDLMSRNVCNELEHFVILNYSSRSVSDEYVSSVTDKICRSRNEITLPALVFNAGQVIELDDTVNIKSKIQPQPLSAMLNALEISLKRNYNNVISYNLKKNVASEFVQRISRIIGVKNILELDENLTLKDLLLNEISIEEINMTIKNTYEISYPTKKLKRITIANIKNLGLELSKTASCKDSGLGAFFTYIDDDECSAAEPVVSEVTSFSSVVEEEDLDPKDTYLMLVPGFEGHHHIFATVSEKLKIQALTFQLVPDMTNDSVAQIAANVAKFMRKRLELKSKFYILGYSFGVNIALEIARLLENEGLVGMVYCLDSSPDALRAQLDAYIGSLTVSQLQNTIIEHMFKLISGRNSTELKQELESKENWADKVELCVTKLRGIAKYSHQYKRDILNSAYRRIILAREYEPDFKLESELVLIKGIPHPNMIKLADDFNLSKHTNKPVQVYDIDSDHALAHQDDRVSNIINGLLEPKLLEEFKNKNLCWTYLADGFKSW